MPVVESANELKELPLYALLAFASRCARRVVGLFRLEANHPELDGCRESVAAAILLAEALAAGKDIDPDELAAAEEGTVRAVVAASEMLPPDERAAYAANAAYAALCAAKAALEVQGDDPGEELAERIAEAAEIARDSAVSADDRVERAARLDWEMLHRMFLGNFPDFGEPIDAAETGMLGALFQDRARGTTSDAKPSPSGDSEVKEKSRLAPAAKARARKQTEPEAASPVRRLSTRWRKSTACASRWSRIVTTSSRIGPGSTPKNRLCTGSWRLRKTNWSGSGNARFSSGSRSTPNATC